MNKVIVIGLDGATFDVIKPLISKKLLPNIAALMDTGTYATMISTTPPITGPAWLAMATGLNPGKTGILDFLNRKSPDDYSLKSVKSDDFKNRAVWDILSTKNIKSGIFCYPMLYPPYPINGFMSSGIGTIFNEKSFAPPELYEEIISVAKDYDTVLNYHNEKYADIDLYFKDALNYFENYKKAFFHLIKNKEWDLFFGVASISDWTQHLMWKYWENPETDKEKEYHNKFIAIWQEIDKFIGEAHAYLPNTNMILVSDHGFGKQDVCFNLTAWLQKTKLMRLKKTKNTEKKKLLELIDFKKSSAFCLGHTFPFGGIYINAPKNSKKYSKILNKIQKELSKLEKKYTLKVKTELYKTDEMYSGSKVELLPDLVLTINNWATVIYEGVTEKPIIEFKSHSTRHTGIHRMNGIFIAAGPDIKNSPGPLPDIKIYDVFPTLLRFFAITAPPNDGKEADIFKD